MIVGEGVLVDVKAKVEVGVRVIVEVDVVVRVGNEVEVAAEEVVKVLVELVVCERVGGNVGSSSATSPKELIQPDSEIVTADNMITISIGFSNEVIFFIKSRMSLYLI